MSAVSSEIKILSVQADDWETVYLMWERLTFELPAYHFNPFGKPLQNEQRDNLKVTLQRCLSRGDAVVFIAYCDQFCGTISAIRNQQKGYENPESGVLFNLWVDPSIRRKQVGNALVNHAKRWLASGGATSVQVGWHPENREADAFWNSQGFRLYEYIAAAPLNERNL